MSVRRRRRGVTGRDLRRERGRPRTAGVRWVVPVAAGFTAIESFRCGVIDPPDERASMCWRWHP
jgi:hypothetical protein